MKKKAIVPVLLIISLVMSLLSLYLDAQYFVLESDRYDSIGEYFIYNGDWIGLIIIVFIIGAIIFSIYSKKRILSKALLIVAFFIYGAIHTLRFIVYLFYSFGWRYKDIYYVFSFLPDLIPAIVAVLIIIDSLVNCRIIKIVRVVILIIGCFSLCFYVYTFITYLSEYSIWDYISAASSLFFWLGLTVWVWFHRKPVCFVDETEIEKLLRNARLEYEQQLITEGEYLERKKEILNKIK